MSLATIALPGYGTRRRSSSASGATWSYLREPNGRSPIGARTTACFRGARMSRGGRRAGLGFERDASECHHGGDPSPLHYVWASLPLGQSVFGVHDLEDNADEWLRDAVDPRPHLQQRAGLDDPMVPAMSPRFVTEPLSDHELIAIDWSSIEVSWEDADVTDPGDKPAVAGLQRPHLARRISGLMTPERAGARCVRRGPGEPAE